MTIQELREQYYFHDSCITNISYTEKDQRLIILMDFCNWAQSWYKPGDPEVMSLKLTLQGIEGYEGLTGDIDYYSISDAEVKDGKLWLSILDDFHNEYYEYYFSPKDVEVEILGVKN